LITIVIVCTNLKEREKIAGLLSAHHDFQIAAVGKDGYDALQSVKNLKPDVLIMDLHLPGIDAAEFAPILKRASPNTALMVLSNVDENHHAGRVVKAGIAAYLLKQEDMNKLAACVRLVCSGGYYISAPIIIRVFGAVSFLRYFPGQASGFSGFLDKYGSKIPPLSGSERGIITLLTQGFNINEIAKNLHLAEGTVRNCLTSIKRKIGAKNRIQIAIYALIYGLISFESLYNLFT
jgi:DNA-binding NarL/FixJ family response regulator